MQRDIINPWTWQDAYGFVHANRITGDAILLFLAGQTASDSDGHTLHEGDMVAQIDAVLTNIGTILQQADMNFTHVVRLNIYTIDLPALMAAHGHLTERLKALGCRHAGTLLGVSGLAAPGALVEMEVTAAA